mgnify:CR=1 FL=1
METSEEIIDINDDFQESNEEGNYYMNNDSNMKNHKFEEEYDYSIPSNINKIHYGNSSQKESQINEYELYNDYNYNYINNNNSNNDNDNDNDVDPNFVDKKLKEEEEIRRRREIEEFEQRTSPENQNIIDFDEIDNKDDENDVDEEGIIIDNSNYLSKINSNNISVKYREKKNDKNIIFMQNKIKNNQNNENESEDIESKVTQVKNNRNNSYDKDDIITNNNKNRTQKINEDIIIDKNNTDEQEIKNIYKNDSNKNNNNYYIINTKENIDSKLSNDISQSRDYNMNFYDTSVIANESNKKAKSKTSGVFQNLLPNKSFKKFLKTKIKYYMNENDIPKDFINNLKLDENNKNNRSNNNKTSTKSKSNTPNPKKYVQRIKSNDQEIKFNSNYKTIDNFNPNYENDIESLNYKTRPKIQKRNTSNTYYKSMKNFYRNNNIRYDDNNLNIIFDKNNNNNYYQNEESDEKYISNYDKVFLENKINKEKIENLQKELNNQKNVMNEKLYKINMLENMNDNLKNEMNKLQQNFEYERINNKETKRNYDMIKNNYTDMKNQYDLLNLKYITLNDENFNYRRDKDLYEKQIKSKNEMIENLLENTSANKKKNMNDKLIEINYNTKSSNEIVFDYIKNKNASNKIISSKPEKEENNLKNESDKKVVDYHKYDKLTFPELQCKRDELLNERRDTNNIYCKIPLKSTSKEQINKRTMLEDKIKEINCDLMIVKLRLKNFKNKK